MAIYPWYEADEFDDLQQGDLLPDLLVPVISEEIYSAAAQGKGTEKLEFEKIHGIIVSQSCDLANGSTNQVLICPCFKSSDLIDSHSKRKEVAKERLVGLHMIEKSGVRPQMIINFRQIYTLPINAVRIHCKGLTTRERLLPPYREHLSQSFARCFMRVGIPAPLDVD